MKERSVRIIGGEETVIDSDCTDLDGRSILGDVLEAGIADVKGDDMHPATKAGITRRSLEVVSEHSSSGKENYSKVIRNVAIAGGAVTLGTILYKMWERRRKQKKFTI